MAELARQKAAEERAKRNAASGKPTHQERVSARSLRRYNQKPADEDKIHEMKPHPKSQQPPPRAAQPRPTSRGFDEGRHKRRRGTGGGGGGQFV